MITEHKINGCALKINYKFCNNNTCTQKKILCRIIRELTDITFPRLTENAAPTAVRCQLCVKETDDRMINSLATLSYSFFLAASDSALNSGGR
jgi:hypothetical protein